MRHLKTTLAVLGAVTVLVLAGNTIAIAATGGGFILGKSNSAGKQTTLSRTTNGPVLKLNSKQATGVPLAVRGTGKVANLNADKVDGLDSSLLVNQTRVYEASVNLTSVDGFSLKSPTLPAGTYLVSANAWIYGPTSGPSPGIDCFIHTSDPDRYIDQIVPYNSNGYYPFTISGVVRLNSAKPVIVGCGGAPGNYSSFTKSPVQLSLTRIGQATNGALVPNS